MSLTIDGFNLYVKQDDAFSIRGTSTGSLTLEVGNTCTMQIKRTIVDTSSVIEKTFGITTENQFDFEFTTADTENLIGNYFYSVKYIDGSNQYTIIPDGGNEEYPTIRVGGVLIE